MQYTFFFRVDPNWTISAISDIIFFKDRDFFPLNCKLFHTFKSWISFVHYCRESSRHFHTTLSGIPTRELRTIVIRFHLNWELAEDVHIISVFQLLVKDLFIAPIKISLIHNIRHSKAKRPRLL